MMEIVKALILGCIQGLTEFLPVSSSGHLELAKFILGDSAVGEESLMMTVVLHFGTALATIVVFRNEIGDIVNGFFSKDKEKVQFVLKIILSMIPAAIVGVFFESVISNMFTQNVLLVSVMLLITAVLLWTSERVVYTPKSLGVGAAFIIGISQAVAILPGLSRSGATISTALILGIDRLQAARFSFLMVVPLIFGKIFKDILSGDLMQSSPHWPELVVGFFSSFFVGLLACKWMITIVQSKGLKYFAYYCLFVGLVGLICIFFNG